MCSSFPSWFNFILLINGSKYIDSKSSVKNSYKVQRYNYYCFSRALWISMEFQVLRCHFEMRFLDQASKIRMNSLQRSIWFFLREYSFFFNDIYVYNWEKTPWKWHHFDRAKHIFKILTRSWAKSMLPTSFRSLKEYYGSLSRKNDCKAASLQIWRSNKNSAVQPTVHHTRAALVQVLDDWIILKVCLTALCSLLT